MNKIFLTQLKMHSDVLVSTYFQRSPSGHSEPLSFLFSAAPSFVEELIDQAAALGQCVTLSCRTAAQSSLHIDWFRGDAGNTLGSP